MRPMSRDFFNTQLTRLKQTYGERSYPDIRTEQLWERFDGVTGYEFMKAVNNLIMSSRYAPLLPDFLGELYEPLRAAQARKEAKLTEGRECFECRNTGRVSVKLNEKDANYSFRCECYVGGVLFPNFPTNNPRIKNETTERTY